MHQATVVALDSEIALRAARLSLELRMPMADSVMLATSRAHDATLWTQDEDFEGQPGVRYVSA
jgi:predicted nucleic acid-binding protein